MVGDHEIGPCITKMQILGGGGQKNGTRITKNMGGG